HGFTVGALPTLNPAQELDQQETYLLWHHHLVNPSQDTCRRRIRELTLRQNSPQAPAFFLKGSRSGRRNLCNTVLLVSCVPVCSEAAMVRASVCPSAQQWQQLVLGQTPEAEAQALEAHLAECSACLDVVRGIKTDDTLTEEFRSQATPADRPIPETVRRL